VSVRRPGAAAACCAIALGAAACGGGGHASVLATTLETCSVTSSGVGMTTSGGCVFVLGDGRRFRCPLRFGGRPLTAATIETSRACVALAAAVVPAFLRPVAARIAQARACLERHGLAVTGGLVLASPRGPDATDGELDTSDALIAYYSGSHQAAAVEPEVAKNMRALGATVARGGADNVAWLVAPSRTLRHTLAVCVGR
jgi:hypothetical protein